ncbi:D-inositol-3-phosphate glycosyltransferase [uncultured archaeon]|nr:D-inositol-3-phosphate glycosyltransferase [uncultured archaeon]
MNTQKKKEKLLIISPFFRPNIGGVETHLHDLCEYLRIHGYMVYVLTYQPITTKAMGAAVEKKDNLEIRRFSWFGFNLFHKLERYPYLEFLYLTPWLLLRSFFFMLQNPGKVDVIHSHGFNASFIANILSRVFKKRFIVSTHAIYGINMHSLNAVLMKWTLNSADKILTLSKKSKKELIKFGLLESKINVYTYWVNHQIFKPMNKIEAKKKVGWYGKFIVLFVGRFIKIKGASILLDVAGQTQNEIHFAFIGDGPMSGNIRKSSEKMPNVIFVGKVENNELPLYYNASDVFIIPSLYDEGFGRVILEALSCGVPVIGADKGGIPEAIDRSVSILIEPTLENLKSAIEELYNDKRKYEMLAGNCRDYAITHFSDCNAKIIVDSYTEIAKE